MEAAVAVNWLAIVVAAVARFAIGAAWYAPPVFGRQWQQAVGAQRGPEATPAALVVVAVGSLIMAYVLARVMGHYGADDLAGGMLVAFMMWLGFMAPFMLSETLFEKRPMRFFYVTSGYQLVSLVVMGAIIGLF